MTEGAGQGTLSPFKPSMKKTYVIPGLLLVLFLATASLVALFHAQVSYGSGTDRGTRNCTVTTSSKAVVGHQLSSTLLAANSLRSWARVSLVTTAGGVATNTIAVSLDEGASASLGNGLTIATGTPTLDVGKNTDQAYTGAITGLTDTGSTTVMITECEYNP